MRIIVSHGDGDGIISAAVLKKEFPEAKVSITQPFLIDKVQIENDVDEIYVIDVGVNNRNPQQTIDFVKAHLDKIQLWVDHHAGIDLIAEILSDKLLYDADAPSCPALLAKRFEVPEEWVNAANACDRPTNYPATELSDFYNHAFKVALVELQDGNREVVEKVQRAFIDYLISGIDPNGIIGEYARHYEPLLKRTEKAVKDLTELLPSVGYVKLEDTVDKTALFTKGYEKFPFVVIQFYSRETNEDITAVATNTKTNLVELFGLSGGAPFRVNLSTDTGHGESHPEQLSKVQEAMSALE